MIDSRSARRLALPLFAAALESYSVDMFIDTGYGNNAVRATAGHKRDITGSFNDALSSSRGV